MFENNFLCTWNILVHQKRAIRQLSLITVSTSIAARLLCLTGPGGLKMGDEKEARECIGEDICDMILNSAGDGTIDANKMGSLAFGLNKEVGGAHST